MNVNRIAENYVVRQVFVLAGVIFLIFRGRLGDFFWPRLLGASLNYAFLGGRDGLFLGGWALFFLRGYGSGQAPIALARIRTGHGFVRIFLFFWIGGGAELEGYGGY